MAALRGIYIRMHISLSLYIYIYIYRERERERWATVSCEVKRLFYFTLIFCDFKVQNVDPNRSSCSPYWNVLGDQILHFLKFFYYLLTNFESSWSDGPENFTVFHCLQQNSNFQKCLINSKKIPKNIKFGLQAHFNMENKMNGLDRHFELKNRKIWTWSKIVALLHNSP